MDTTTQSQNNDLLAKLVAIETKLDALTELITKNNVASQATHATAAAGETYVILAEGRPWKSGKKGAFYFCKRNSDEMRGSVGISDGVARGGTFSKGDTIVADGDVKIEEYNGEQRFSLFARHVILQKSAYQAAADTTQGEDVPF